MKKLIAVIGLCMMACIIPASAENTIGVAPGIGNGSEKCKKEHPSPEKIIARIDERLKKLEEHKAKAASNGKTEIVSAIQNLENALNNVKDAINVKDRDAVKTAKGQVKSAREALRNLIGKAKEHHAKDKNNDGNNGKPSNL